MAEPMTDARLDQIEASHAEHCPVACCTGYGDHTPDPCYVSDLIAEVRRLSDFVKYLAEQENIENPAGAFWVVKELARRTLTGESYS